ncbi:pilin [Patescibacteria group bacterium]
MKKIILFLILGLLLILPLTSSAQCVANSTCPEGERVSSCCPTEGLVPCGTTCCPCQFCDFFVLFEKIIDFVLNLVIIIAVLMIVIGGFMFLFSGANPNLFATSKRILTSTVIGLTIIFGAWIIINTFFAFIGLSDFGLQLTGPGEWFIIKCN